MDTLDKIKHFVTLKNQYTKNHSEQTLKTIKEIEFRYQITPLNKPNRFGAQEFKCGKTAFRVFQGKLVNKELSSLMFFKIIEDDRKDKKDLLDWSKRFY